MKLGIMQPYFIPYLGYWQLLNAVDQYVLYDDVNYIKGGWINRNRILMGEEEIYFNIPMLDASPNKNINEIKVNNNTVLKRKNLNRISGAYKKSPHFDDIYPLCEKIINYDANNISEYIYNSMKLIMNYLGIETNIIISSELKKDNSLKGEEKVIHICKLLGATEYYNAIGGMELYNKEKFKENGIGLQFVKMHKIIYEQNAESFHPNLSIIDVLMNNSIEEIKKMLLKYELC